MSQRTLEAHYRPNQRLTEAFGYCGYNCGYTEAPGTESFDQHQRTLVWQLLGDAAITKETTIIDVGCGIGGPCTWILDRYHPRRIIGLDYLWSCIHTAKQRARPGDDRLHYLQGDAHRLPLADASTDVVFNLESALHYADKDAFLGECRRVLKPGGILCLGDITTESKVLFAPLTLLNGIPTQFNSNIHLWSGQDYRGAFGRHGLQLLRHRRVSPAVVASLTDGLNEISGAGWAASRGFRARYAYLMVLKALLNSGRLSYDLFAAQAPFPSKGSDRSGVS
jgi:2-polyprenyl-3-methyl-5-hydroxy-6-metoxy-1,4-benzoquinol methylase